jgi:hypothetical protein
MMAWRAQLRLTQLLVALKRGAAALGFEIKLTSVPA